MSLTHADLRFKADEGHVSCFAHVLNLAVQDAIEKGMKIKAWVVEEDGVTVVKKYDHVPGQDVSNLVNQIREYTIFIK